MNSSVSTAALQYVQRGWMPVPLYGMERADMDGGTVEVCQCWRITGNDCGKSAGKHPIAGAWQQRDWRGWDGWANHRGNVGIVTGRISGFWVLDYDVDNSLTSGAALVGRLEREGVNAHVRTGGGGLHWRFALSGLDYAVTNRRGRLPKGLDVRGDGGQVVAPPSVSGKGLYVELRPGVDVAPDWLIDLIRPAVSEAALTVAEPQSAVIPAGSDRAQRYAVAALRAECETYAALDDGRRGDAAWRLACRAVELANLGGLSQGMVRHQVTETIRYAREHGPPGGLSDAEAWRLYERARAEVGDRKAEIVGPDPLAGEPMPPGFALPFSPAPQVGATPSTAGSVSTPIGSVSRSDPMPTMTDAGAGPAMSVQTSEPAGAATASTPTDPFENAVRIEAWKIKVRDEARRRLEAARVAGRPPLELELIEADKLDTIGTLEPLIPGVLLVDSLARINGRPGQGKSFVVADLACSVASGAPWAGQPVRRGPVLAVVAEGVSGFRDRVRAWEREHGVTLAPEEFALFPRAPLVGGPEWPAFVALAAARRPVLVTIDTQARSTVGLKENDATDMGVFVDGLEQLRAATGACVLVVHHASKEGDAGRGSNAVEGAMSSEFSVTRAGGTVTVRTTKQKDLEQGPALLFDLKPVEMSRDLGGGMSEPALPSAVLVYRDPRVGAAEGAPIDIGKARQRALWTVMADSYAADGGTRAEIRASFKDHVLLRDLGASTFRGAWATAWAGLVRLGLIAKRGERFRIVVVTNQSEDGVLTPNPDIADGGVGQLGASWTLWTPDDENRNSVCPSG